MPSSNPSSNDDDVSLDPAAPRTASAVKKGTSPAPVSPDTRQRSNSRKPEQPPPTLLADFFMGRPSAARIAAERQRRKSVDAVKAELRYEMKQSAVKKVQPPGGVKDRVKAWQKSNAAAATGGAEADDAATEPTEVAFKGDDEESVTEEDRVRIKLRQKKKSVPRTRPPIVIHKAAPEIEPSETAEDARPQSPPKKRVVSDEHWRKTRGGRTSPPRRVSPRMKKSLSPSPNPTPTPATLPKDFVIRSGPNPTVSSKIKSWAQKVEVPDTPSPRSNRSSKSRKESTRFEDTPSEVPSDTASQVTATRPLRSRSGDDDGIRVTPTRKKKLDDDGNGLSAVSSSSHNDDGIRVRPVSGAPSEKISDTHIPSSATRPRRKTTGTRPGKVFERIKALQEPTELSKSPEGTTEMTTEIGEDDETSRIVVEEEPDSVLDTPTKRPGSRRRSTGRSRPKTYHPRGPKPPEDASWLSDEDSALGRHQLGSDLTSSVAAKSVADLPGEIPFGHSAFSELDLPLNGVARSRPKRMKVERNSSLKAMPNVFKKVVEEGKKIIQDMNEPPRNVTPNKPPSIEKWLNGTVDPFVEPSSSAAAASSPKSKAAEKEFTEDSKTRRRPSQDMRASLQPPPNTERNEKPKARRHSSYETKLSRPSTLETETLLTESTEDQENVAPITGSNEAKKRTDSPKESDRSPSAGLKRSQATRGPSSPWKTKSKLPFFGMLKEAFQGESSGISHPLNSYQSHEERRVDDDYDSMDDETVLTGSGLSSALDEDSASRDERTPKMAGPRLRPPTNGHHELSTIMSEEDSSAVESDMSSDLSHSTLTQSTILTKDSELSKSQTPGPGLKRRLTKHSDLVSVLSLPDDSTIPRGIKSSRSRPSLRRNRGTADEVTVDDLLKEFADDENLYLRELKTLVDGVVPVLLSQVVDGSNTSDLFDSRPTESKADVVSKSVVSMGVALEKLRNAHKKAPTSDLRRLAHWAHGVVPIYNSYLSAWRLGFQDLVVNLAPAAEDIDDEDSLLNALPRNERGDVIDATGERVDVAHLLKRPLLRVKQMAKFIKCMDSILATNDTNDLLRDFENLQDKARRRHREETARITDEDAFNTDVTRCRKLQTLEAMDSIAISSNLQVNAKDVFSLNLEHSNGQRLECQVELVHRDNQRHPEEEGDVLIREVGDGRRSYLLFPPFPVSTMSARTGDGDTDMVIMIRGAYKDRQWHELLILSADDEDQILDWLDILPLNPVPPREPEPSVAGDLDELPSQKRRSDIPVGARSLRIKSPRSPNVEVFPPPESPTTPTKRPLPARYHPRAAAPPSTPPQGTSSPSSQASDKTPTQDLYDIRVPGDQSRPLRDGTRPDPVELQNATSTTTLYREDGAPPPPVHRELSPGPQSKHNSAPSLSPSRKSKASRIQRRTSSPLKHEYLPSDVSSVSGTSISGESESDSSDDEIESVDIPETELGLSIQDEQMPPPIESLLSDLQVSASECSLTPSNSASQAGLHGHKTAPNEGAARYMATISRWSEKGAWKDISVAPCSIIVKAGLIEAYTLKPSNAAQDDTPLLALDLTPLVLIRQSTAVDLEIRSSIQPHCQLSQAHGGGNFRFRCHNAPECFSLYMSVHHARLNNQKFIQLENEARFKSFGERQRTVDNDGDSSSRRRSWFGRKNSYRSSVRAPSQDGASTTPSSSLSASSFLKRLTVGGNLSFNIARSSVDRQSRAGSGGNSLYTSSSSSSGTPPRSPSISVGNSSRAPNAANPENIRIRLHLLVSAAKWEDFGNCSLQIRRPPPGWHQALRADHGLEKRITVTTLPKKDSEKAKIVLDAVLGSGCFTPMGNRGIVCGVWEDAKGVDGADGIEGVAPATGQTGGNIKKWCFQFGGAPEANWVLRMVHQEVMTT